MEAQHEIHNRYTLHTYFSGPLPERSEECNDYGSRVTPPFTCDDICTATKAHFANVQYGLDYLNRFNLYRQDDNGNYNVLQEVLFPVLSETSHQIAHCVQR